MMNNDNEDKLSVEERLKLYETALRMIAGREQCLNNLMSNVDIANFVLDKP